MAALADGIHDRRVSAKVGGGTVRWGESAVAVAKRQGKQEPTHGREPSRGEPRRPSATPTHDEDGFVLPVGTVTLLLADIEGSTVLWENTPEEMTRAIERFDAVVNGAVALHEGVRPIEQGEGDRFVAAFARATDALACALDLQVEFAANNLPFRVRMAVHTGEVQRRDEGNYVGSTINRCARLRAIAHGAQTLLSQTAHDLVIDHLPDGASLLDMGTHRLRDLSRPERVYQLRHDGIEANDAPLRSLDVVPHNLPAQLTSFVGREREISSVARLLGDNRMVTLLGTGGCGKTRLSLQVAADVVESYQDGVWFVELAPVDDPAAVPQAVAGVLGEREPPGSAAGTPSATGPAAADTTARASDTLARAIGDRSMLLVLDNCEHVVAATSQLAAVLLTRCHRLTVLATSREALAIPGELTFHVPSLTVPAELSPMKIDTLAAYEAVELFIDRAARARPNFTVTNDNAPAVAEICQRLGGIPLALELAAARTRVLSPEQICAGLADRFRLLTGGSRTGMPRQQTLRASVDWSFDLLSLPERTTLERLSVFAGGFDLDAAEYVVAGDGIESLEVLDLMSSLVDKSLVVADEQDGGIRYHLLETMRQYGNERLDAAGSDDTARLGRRHRAFYRELLLRAAVEEEGPNQARWSARVRAELDNVAVALHSAQRDGDADDLAALTIGAGNTWTMIGRTSESRRWLTESERLLPPDSPWRAQTLYQLGVTDGFAGEIDSAIQRYEEAVPLYRAKGDHAGALWALEGLCSAIALRDGSAAADPLYEQSISEATERNELGALFAFEYGRAAMRAYEGDLGRARSMLEEVLARPAVVEHMGRWARTTYGWILAMQGELLAAEVVLVPLIDQARPTGDVMVLGIGTWSLGYVRLFGGDRQEAGKLLAEAMSYGDDMGAFQMAPSLWAQGLLALADGDPAGAIPVMEEAARVAASASALHKAVFDTAVAQAHLAIGNTAAAREIIAGALTTARRRDLGAFVAEALIIDARVRLALGDPSAAEDAVHEAMTISRANGRLSDVAEELELIGALAVRAESFEEAGRLFGAAETLRTELGFVFRLPLQQRSYDDAVDAARLGLGRERLAEAWAEGSRMSWADACDYAARGRGARKRPSTGWDALTPVEERVVELVAEGLTNAQVGARLFISRHTVDSHLRHVFAKLGVSSRAELTAQSIRREHRSGGRGPGAADGADA